MQNTKALSRVNSRPLSVIREINEFENKLVNVIQMSHPHRKKILGEYTFRLQRMLQMIEDNPHEGDDSEEARNE